VSLGKVCPFVALAVALSAQTKPIADELRRGQMLQGEGRLVEAEESMRAAVRDSEAEPAEIRVTVLSNMASVEADLGRLDEAARIYNRALRVLKKYSPENVNRIRTLEIQIAEMYLEANQESEAEKRIKNIISTIPDPTVPESSTAYALDVLACAYSSRKDLPAAESAERQSLSLLNALPDADPGSIAVGTLHLSVILNKRNRPEDALPHADHALNLFKTLPSPQIPMQASAEINLASIYSRLGRREDAREKLSAALTAATQFYGADHPKTALILLAGAAVLRALSEKHEARDLQHRAERILTSNRRWNLDSTVSIDALLGR